MRALFMDFPGDPNVADIPDECVWQLTLAHLRKLTLAHL